MKKGSVNIAVKVLKAMDRNYHTFTWNGYTSKFWYENFRTLTEQRNAIENGEFGREGVPIELFDFNSKYDAFIDIGAHFGVYSVITGIMNPDIPIHAFEPTEYNRRVMIQNLELNELAAQVTLHQHVVTDTNGTVVFYQDPDFKGSTRDTATPPDDPSDEFIEVEQPAISLSSFLNDQGYESPFLKIDAEGAEFDILQDLFEEYDGSPRGMVEVHSTRLESGEEAVLDLLSEQGYEINCVKELPPTNRAFTFY